MVLSAGLVSPSCEHPSFAKSMRMLSTSGACALHRVFFEDLSPAHMAGSRGSHSSSPSLTPWIYSQQWVGDRHDTHTHTLEHHCISLYCNCNHHRTVTILPPYCHHTITVSSLHRHCTISEPSLRRHCTITAPPGRCVSPIGPAPFELRQVWGGDACIGKG